MSLLVNVGMKLRLIRVDALIQRDTHRDRADIELFLGDHPHCLQNFRCIDHTFLRLS